MTKSGKKQPPSTSSGRAGFVVLLLIALVGGLFWLGLWWARASRGGRRP